MRLIKWNQETDDIIINHVFIVEHKWTQLEIYEDYTWRIKKKKKKKKKN